MPNVRRTETKGVFATGESFWVREPTGDGRYRWRRFPTYFEACRFVGERKKSRGPTIGWVYFVAPVGGGPVKIGWSRQPPARRLRELQVGSPVQLEVIGSYEGTITAENQLHQRFRAHRLHGEWFEPTAEILATACPPAEVA